MPHRGLNYVYTSNQNLADIFTVGKRNQTQWSRIQLVKFSRLLSPRPGCSKNWRHLVRARRTRVAKKPPYARQHWHNRGRAITHAKLAPHAKFASKQKPLEVSVFISQILAAAAARKPMDGGGIPMKQNNQRSRFFAPHNPLIRLLTDRRL